MYVKDPVRSNVNLFCLKRFQQSTVHITCTIRVFLLLNKWKGEKQREIHTIIDFLDTIHRPFFFLFENNVSETGLRLRYPVKSLVSLVQAIVPVPNSGDGNAVFKNMTMDNVKNVNNCINITSSQTFRSYKLNFF
jgi:hypothetical protein